MTDENESSDRVMIPGDLGTMPSLRDADLEARQRPAPFVGVVPVPVPANGGRKFDGGKHRMWLLGPLWRPIRAVVRVLEFGAAKYAPNNWQLVRDEDEMTGEAIDAPPLKRYGDALQRHVAAFQEGETRDAETGLHPLAHAACDALFLLWFVADDDGRPASEEEIARRVKRE